MSADQPSNFPARPVALRIPRRKILAGASAVAGLAVIGARSAAAQPIHPIRTATPEPSPTARPASTPATPTTPATPAPIEAPPASPTAPPAVVPDPVRAGATFTTATGDITYFPDTGHNISDPILSVWKSFGGENLLYSPLSEEMFDDNTAWILQYFPGIVFGYDPAADQPTVSPMLFTDDQVAALLPAGMSPSTGARVTGAFKTFYDKHDGATLLGQAISATWKDDAGQMRQLFENGMLQQTSAGVWIYPIWKELSTDAGLLSNDAFVPQPPTGGQTYLVTATEGLNLRDDPRSDAPVLTLVPEDSEFIAATTPNGDWLAGYVNGYAGWLAKQWLTEPPQLPQLSGGDWKLNIWQGVILGDTNVREQPTTKAKTVKQMGFGDQVEVSAWVQGEETYPGADLWAQIGNNQYVYGRNVGRNAPVAPTPIVQGSPAVGNWIDVNLTQQLMIAYEGTTPVRTVVMTSGMPPYQTPEGWYQIGRRVANEEMTSGSIGAEEFFDLKNVLFTQYFTDRGHAIHFAWWRTEQTIGRPGSHGCLNLLLEDARFFWDWADIGTTLVIHY